jgi:hypothetical protein
LTIFNSPREVNDLAGTTKQFAAWQDFVMLQTATITGKRLVEHAV